MTDLVIPTWFWATLEAARPSLQKLASILEQMPREQLIDFAARYRSASLEICDYWDGPNVDDIQFSEDDTEDLCNWVVSQGRRMWEQAIACSASLEPIVRAYWDSESEGNSAVTTWSREVDNPLYRGYQAPEYIAIAVFRARFDEDLEDFLEE